MQAAIHLQTLSECFEFTDTNSASVGRRFAGPCPRSFLPPLSAMANTTNLQDLCQEGVQGGISRTQAESEYLTDQNLRRILPGSNIVPGSKYDPQLWPARSAQGLALDLKELTELTNWL